MTKADHIAGVVAEKDAEIARLRAALRECAAPFVSDPGTVMQTAGMVSREFMRRQQLAADAIREAA
jgi:hypothetical protein